MSNSQRNSKIVAGALIVSAWAIDVAVAPEAVQASSTASGELSASVSIPYSCDVTSVDVGTLTGSSASYDYTGSFTYSQNDDTVWNVSGGSVSMPSNASLAVGITVTDTSLASDLVSLSQSFSSTGSIDAASGTLTGNYASNTGQYIVDIEELVGDTMYAGDYVITGTISCEQDTL